MPMVVAMQLQPERAQAPIAAQPAAAAVATAAMEAQVVEVLLRQAGSTTILPSYPMISVAAGVMVSAHQVVPEVAES